MQQKNKRLIHTVHSDSTVVVLLVPRVCRTLRMLTVGQAATKRPIVVETDIFLNEENKK